MNINKVKKHNKYKKHYQISLTVGSIGAMLANYVFVDSELSTLFNILPSALGFYSIYRLVENILNKRHEAGLILYFLSFMVGLGHLLSINSIQGAIFSEKPENPTIFEKFKENMESKR
ncbi:hypothetical protein [Vibrio crassostreae]|uniref:hypothetical protein n=1 Tax=Vibrio crassostreae TaxID=246167 RepID=UPI001B30CE67|nr:hypothetical protein [Vibrio crassostreae]